MRMMIVRPSTSHAAKSKGSWKTKWRRFGAGRRVRRSGGAKHAFRNVSTTDVLLVVITTMALGRFFQSVGRPLSEVPSGPPSSDTLQRFAQASLAEGHWLGSVDDNAAIGISLSFS